MMHPSTKKNQQETPKSLLEELIRKYWRGRSESAGFNRRFHYVPLNLENIVKEVRPFFYNLSSKLLAILDHGRKGFSSFPLPAGIDDHPGIEHRGFPWIGPRIRGGGGEFSD